jgi:hypothetical protein
MVSLLQENPSENSSIEPAIPNFREDERLQSRYATLLQRRITTFGIEHQNSIRRHASQKRDELRDEMEAAQAEYERCNEIAAQTREAYRAAYPQHVKKTRLVAPSAMENLRSLGGAAKLYGAAHDAWLAAERATSALRRIEHNEGQVDVELARALERSPQIAREVTTSEEWLAEIHAEEEMAAVKARVDAIVAEREDYATRLAAGTVTATERRLRAFAEEGIAHVTIPLSGVMFLRVAEFGAGAYVILRDLRKQCYALPYDRRLEPLLDGVYDLAKTTDGVEARRSLRVNGTGPLTVAEHLLACNDKNDAAALEEGRVHREFVKARRMIENMQPADDLEASALEALAALATA